MGGGLTLPSPAFWAGRRVWLTGHTGFKGTWLALWLRRLGAEVSGFALAPEPGSLGQVACLGRLVVSEAGDVRDAARVHAAMARARPEIVLHLAAQSLVRRGYAEPVATFGVNVMGTVHVLEAARHTAGVRAVVVVTSDKCYAPGARPRREPDRLGGHDPYSASKAAAELAAAAWRHAFAGPAIATARAGNVVGGGDTAADRLVPDCLRAWSAGRPVRVRHPEATRPWQHVLDPLCGYLLLAERLADEPDLAQAWNFGPAPGEALPVAALVAHLARAWGGGAAWAPDPGPHPPEAPHLALDATQARERLSWQPRLTTAEALDWTVAWTRSAASPAERIEADIARYGA